MANLSIADLKKRENPEKFANKIFHVNGAACEFATENGRFHLLRVQDADSLIQLKMLKTTAFL